MAIDYNHPQNVQTWRSVFTRLALLSGCNFTLYPAYIVHGIAHVQSSRFILRDAVALVNKTLASLSPKFVIMPDMDGAPAYAAENWTSFPKYWSWSALTVVCPDLLLSPELFSVCEPSAGFSAWLAAVDTVLDDLLGVSCISTATTLYATKAAGWNGGVANYWWKSGSQPEGTWVLPVANPAGIEADCCVFTCLNRMAHTTVVDSTTSQTLTQTPTTYYAPSLVSSVTTQTIRAEGGGIVEWYEASDTYAYTPEFNQWHWDTYHDDKYTLYRLLWSRTESLLQLAYDKTGTETRIVTDSSDVTSGTGTWGWKISQTSPALIDTTILGKIENGNHLTLGPGDELTLAPRACDRVTVVPNHFWTTPVDGDPLALGSSYTSWQVSVEYRHVATLDYRAAIQAKLETIL